MAKRNLLPLVATFGIPLGALAQTPPPKGISPRQMQMPTMQVMMQNNSGSLLQASLPQQAENNDKTPAFSLTAVPEQQPKILKKHDLITIIVQEVSQFASTGTTDLQKSADFDAKVDQWISLKLGALSVHGTGQATNPVETKLEGTRDFKGEADVDRSDTFTLRLEAEVIDVKPNGTMVIQAKKHIKTDEEDQQIILTGTCRVQDIDSSNSVLSTALHDLDIQKITKGAVRDTTKRGLIPRLLDFINPF
jgi:flagellar L-ring protein precursor FlgH